MKKIKRKEKGVSEVVGNLLILSITVMLFSSIYIFVNNMPQPNPQTYGEFTVKFINATEGGKYYFELNVTNIGGERLSTTNTLFVVVVTHNDGNIEIKRHLLAEISNWPSKNKKSLGDGDFKVGESFFYLSKNDSLELLPDDGLTVLLIDKSNNQVIWQSTLRGKPNIPPIVLGVTTKPSPLVKGKIGKIYVTLFDPDPADSVDNYTVHLHGEWLNLTLDNEGGGIYSGRVLVPDNIQSNRYYAVTVVVNNSENTKTVATSLEYIYVRSPIVSLRGVWLNLTPDSVLLSDESPTHDDLVSVTITLINEGDTAAKFYIRVVDIKGRYQIETNDNWTTIKQRYGLEEGKDFVFVYKEEKWWYIPAAGVTSVTVIWKVGQGFWQNISVAGNHTLYMEAWNVRYLDDTVVEDPGYNSTYKFVTVLPKILLVDANGDITDDCGYSPVQYMESALRSIDFDYTKVAHLTSDPVAHTGYDVIIWCSGYNTGPSSEQVADLKDFYGNYGGVWVISSVYTTGTDVDSGSMDGTPNPYHLLENFSAGFVRRYSGSYGANIYDAKQSLINVVGGNVQSVTEVNAIPVIAAVKGNGKFVWESLEFSRIENLGSQAKVAYDILMWLTGITGKTGRDVAIGGIDITPTRPLYNQEVIINVTVRNNGMMNESTEVVLYIDGQKIDTLPTGTIPAYGGETYVEFHWIAKPPGVHSLSVVVDPLNIIPETNEENNYLQGVMPTKIEVLFSTLLIYDSTDPDTTFSTANRDIIKEGFEEMGYALNITTHTALENNSYFGTGRVFSSYNLVIYVGSSGGSGTSQHYYLSTTDKEEICEYINTYRGHLLFIGSTIAEDMLHAKIMDLFGLQINETYHITGTANLYGVNYADNAAFRGMGIVVSGTSSPPWQDVDWLKFASSTGLVDYGGAFDTVYRNEWKPTWGYGVRLQYTDGSKVLILPFDINSVSDFVTDVEGEGSSDATQRTLQVRYYILFRAMMYYGQIEWNPELAVDEVDISVSDEHPMVGHRYVLSVKIHNHGDVGTSCLVRFYERDELIGSDSIYVGPKNISTTEIIWIPLFGSSHDLIKITVDEINEITEKQWNTSNSGYTGEMFSFNNIAKHYLPVYFFWDDLENGTANWNHDATILNINGESPLDFLNRQDVSTNVIGDWDWSYSGSTDEQGRAYLDGNGIYLTTNSEVIDYTHGESHSVPKAFWLPEVPGTAGERIPLDIFLVVDNSGSMDDDPDGDGNTKWDDLVNAIQNDILPYLTDNDYLTLIAFGDPEDADYNDLNSKAGYVLGNSNLFSEGQDGGADSGEAVVIWYPRNSMTSEHKQDLLNLLTSSKMVPIHDVRYNTPIWDAIGVGIMYAKYYNDTEDYKDGNVIRYPLVIALTDGMDWGKYRGSGAHVGEAKINGGNNGPHGGSEVFGPWWPWGEKHDKQQTQLSGDIISDDNGAVTKYIYGSYGWNWYPVELSNEDSKRYSGLLDLENEPDTGSAPHIGGKIPVFTIGLGLMHFSPPSSGKLKNTHYGHDAGSAEYWLWKIASTSPAKKYGVGYDGYMYASQSSELGAIFQAIMTSIGGTGGVRSSPPTHFDSSNEQSSKGANLRVSSNTTLMEEHFESGLGNWIIDSGDWKVVDSSTSPTGWNAYDGSNYLIYEDDSDEDSWWDPTGADDQIYYNSPLSIPSDATWAILSFAIRWNAPDSYLYAVVDDGGGWTKVGYSIGYKEETPLNSSDSSDDEWLVFSADLTQYIGKTIYIGFYVSDWSTRDNYFAIDDVKVIYGVRESGGGSSEEGSNTYDIPYKKYRFLVTPPVDINNAEKAKLSFWTKYWMTEGTNGGVLYLWGSDDGTTWVWDKDHRYYLIPKQSYTGNLKFDDVDNDATTGGPNITGALTGLIDAEGHLPYWCFNGRSSSGTFGWDYVEVDLSKFIDKFTKIRIVFLFAQFGGVTANTGWQPEMGWYIDDVRVTVSGGNTDYWSYEDNSTEAHSGSHYWYYCAPNGYMPLGVDSSLYTVSIDLTRAYKVTLIAYLRFNINSSSGLPPDGIRIEVSTDNGQTWKSITYGVRIGWNYSGKDTNIVEYRNYYGINNDIPQAYSGVKGEVDLNTHEFIENTSTGYGWIPSVTLARLNCDLSGFVGNTIILRFRVYTNATGSPKDSIHYDSANEPKGVYIDDVFVVGESVGAATLANSYIFQINYTTGGYEENAHIQIPESIYLKYFSPFFMIIS